MKNTIILRSSNAAPNNCRAGDLFIVDGKLSILAQAYDAPWTFSFVSLEDGQIWAKGMAPMSTAAEFVDNLARLQALEGHKYTYLGNRTLTVHAPTGTK